MPAAAPRYLVIPNRPAGTEGWSEEQLMRCVSRDSMIGVALPRSADEAQRLATPA
jgi:nitrile hydratase